uniref:hypothetical protein n=1 Tax=Kitasatospora azatica TaxID=58347 RepID=UPI0005667AA1|nr:hypothetical protein [Kitasatospora azatica]
MQVGLGFSVGLGWEELGCGAGGEEGAGAGVLGRAVGALLAGAVAEGWPDGLAGSEAPGEPVGLDVALVVADGEELRRAVPLCCGPAVPWPPGRVVEAPGAPEELLTPDPGFSVSEEEAVGVVALSECPLASTIAPRPPTTSPIAVRASGARRRFGRRLARRCTGALSGGVTAALSSGVTGALSTGVLLGAGE